MPDRMQTPEKTRKFTTMNSHQMFTLWWEEPWVKHLVLLLSPVGIIDATFTILLFNKIGVSYEYNPIVRAALGSDWWIVWFLVDAVSFFLFIIMGGSYYLYTRRSLVDNRIGIVSGLVALRVGLAAHNVIRFFEVLPAVFGGLIIGLITFIIVDSLFDRESDVSWTDFKRWWKHRLDRHHDEKLVKSVKKKDRGDTQNLYKKTELERDDEENESQAGIPQSRPRVWRKRALYLLSAIALFIVMPFFLVFIGDLTGVTSFSEIYGPFVFWNELSAPAFLIGFFVICIFTASIMYLILRSFEVQEGAW
ncbi:hypothetical protein EU527_06405 [Candidatus Thorarchaeota archaeon]|nr:MAG: hypothetical protein EU527_06405 [Candidatus Thorarchaeota archaeon]